MRLDAEGLKDRQAWEKAGYALPEFDREKVKEKTAEDPVWVHFGAGNIFKAFLANVVQKLLNEGIMDRGLIAAEGFDYEIIEKMNRPHDDYNIAVTLKADGNVEKTVIGSVVESLALDSGNRTEFGRMKEIFGKDSLQMCTFTITEKGYSLVDGKGEVLPSVEEDFKNGPDAPSGYMGKVAALLYARYQAGQKPLAMVSTDNCSHNGDKLYAAISAFAREWVKNGKAEEGFVSYVDDREKVSFPWTMIDKITPRPDASVEQILKEDGVEGLEPVVTSKNTYVAPFVNAEETEYLVIEDTYSNGRPPLELGGVLYVDRETVDKVERMKVTTCLNPLHTALAIYGCLLGYDSIAAEMRDPELKALIEKVGYEEGMPVVTDPGIIKPLDFIHEVIDQRFPNPFMPDTPQRIAMDTSQKISIRFGETIKSYAERPGLDPKTLTYISLPHILWRYFRIKTVADVFRPAMHGKMFGAGGHFHILFIFALHTLDKADAETACQIRVFTICLMSAPPPRVTENIDIG